MTWVSALFFVKGGALAAIGLRQVERGDRYNQLC